MPKKLTQEEFISKALIVHKGSYGYQYAIYRGARNKIDVYCPKHDIIFRPTAANHLKGQLCPLCDNDNRRCKIYGMGINDAQMGETSTIAYYRWHGMLERCYDPKYQNREPTYIGCSVCDEWLTFSNFKKWFDKNYVEGYQLDKDILVKGNKVYSPDTCCFVPQSINSLLLNKKLHRGEMPLGVDKRTENCYAAYIHRHRRKLHLGSFPTPEAAFLAYKKAKEQYVMELAEKYYKEGKITERVYLALLVYKVEITD